MKAIATKDAVYQAAENLVLQGHKPGMITYGMIREAIGGGSNSTINPLLKEWLEERRNRDVKEYPPSPEFLQIGNEFLLRTWDLCYQELLQVLSNKFDVIDSQAAEMERLAALTDQLDQQVAENTEERLANQRRFVACLRQLDREVSEGFGGVLHSDLDPALTLKLQAFQATIRRGLDEALEDQTALLSRYLHARQLGEQNAALASEDPQTVPITDLRTVVAQQIAEFS